MSIFTIFLNLFDFIIRREKIEDAILLFYQKEENTQMSFHEFYLKWLLEYKILKVSNGTLDRIQCSYERFYKDTKLDITAVKDIDILMVDTFIHKTIKDNNLNRKQYNNRVIILRQVLEYAVLMNYIDCSPMKQFKLASNIIRKDIKKKNESQVYMVVEKKQLECIIRKDYRTDNKNTIPLAVLFDFQTGVRLGELVTLKWSNINGDYISIQRTEIRYREIRSDGTKGKYVIEIKDRPKSDAGNREVYLTPKAKEILKQEKKANFQNGYESEFIFVYEKG